MGTIWVRKERRWEARRSTHLSGPSDVKEGELAVERRGGALATIRAEGDRQHVCCQLEHILRVPSRRTNHGVRTRHSSPRRA